jgi:hypothetical protein
MTSVLETEYLEPKRPYSQKELTKNREKLYKQLRLSKTKAYHTKSKYFYFVKKNGRKEKEILQNESNVDIGNCSVSWKLSKTPSDLKNEALHLVNSYMKTFEKEPEILTYDIVDLETMFYRWLYEEI